MSFRIPVYLFALVLATGCNRVGYPPAPVGASEAALLARAKLHCMYETNFIPASDRQDIYQLDIAKYQSGDIAPQSYLKSIDDVNRNFVITVQDKTSSRAITLTVIKNPDFQFFEPETRDLWVYNGQEWLWTGLTMDDSLE